MFRKQKNDEKDDKQEAEELILQYPKPKILLMDIAEDTAQHLGSIGFNVSVGSFGTPYEVNQRSRSVSVHQNATIPEHHAEMEIVIIDLKPERILGEPSGEIVIIGDGDPLVVNPVMGVIDPRPIIMRHLQSDFQRIYAHGGIFIVFAEPKRTITGSLTGSYEEVRFASDHDDINTWCFLPELASFGFQIKAESGREMSLENSPSLLGKILQKHIPDAQYSCTFDPTSSWLSKRWLSTTRNKFNKDTAGLLVETTEQEQTTGFVAMFPQIQDKKSFLQDMLTQYLPEVRPHLFPYFEGGSWINSPDYELPNIVSLQHQVVEIRQRADVEIAELKAKIEHERDTNKFLYDLITETGDPLVEAVNKSLKLLGFIDVVDMDEELEASDSSQPKREDLQIRDASPLVLVEVKGINNIPKDSSALQVSKYLAPRMKQLNRVDIRGLSIINHQRNLPALQRSENPFSEDILESALNGDFGLLTTWNLHRLIRSFRKLSWSHEQISGLFYHDGFIDPIPTHYKYVGYIEHYWAKPNAIGIRIEGADLRLGDRIAYELPIEFEEQDIPSLQEENKDVDLVTKGGLAGVITTLAPDNIVKKMKIYRVKKSK